MRHTEPDVLAPSSGIVIKYNTSYLEERGEAQRVIPSLQACIWMYATFVLYIVIAPSTKSSLVASFDQDASIEA